LTKQREIQYNISNKNIIKHQGGGNMANDYFEYVINNLTIEELNILGILLDQDSAAPYKAMTNQEVFQKSSMTEATYRKVIYGLICHKFIETLNTKKQRNVYLTEYGVMAIQKSLERMTV
jgi:hypothetical protein